MLNFDKLNQIIMKKLFLVLIVTLAMSCGSTKVTRQAQRIIKGNWMLTSVTYDRAGTYDIKLLSDVSKACFELSTWQFVPNDFKGTYSIQKPGCNAGERYFKFDIQEVDPETGLYDFLLKPTDEKYKSETNRGFRLQLAALSDTAMEWQQTLKVDGAAFTISMNFEKAE
jgi:hypothetical protein